MFRLDDKVVIITGGVSGIGLAITTLFLKQGSKVVVFDISEEAIDKLQSQLMDENLMLLPCNIADIGQVHNSVEKIIDRYGKIDILVNNAGVGHIGTATSTSVNDMERLFSVNVMGPYHVMHSVIPHMKEKGGVILNMVSVAASLGISERFGYSATKGALKTMTMSVAKDYLPYNIRCNSISPGRVHTPFVDDYLQKNYPGKEAEMFEKLSKTQPIGRMAKPEEIAYLALFLCSDEASFITGTDYPIDGGFITLNS
jgi:2-keto-3-deoxy-L-fuconate dehydrogenase